MKRTLVLGAFLVALVALPAEAVEMKAGVAKGSISTTEPLVLTNGPNAKGIFKDIMARVLVLNDGNQRYVIATYDLNCLDVATAILRERVKGELDIPIENLVLLATHNHNAPIQIAPGNFEYGRGLADTIFGLIQTAIANEVGPVTVNFGTGDGKFIVSRGQIEPDYEIQALKVMHGDQPLALFFTHGTHPAQVTSDYIGTGHPGYAMDEIEAAMPGVQAMYADACGGDQFIKRPKKLNKKIVAAKKEDGKAAAQALREKFTRETGRKLAKATLKIARGKMIDVTGSIRSTHNRIALPLGDPISLEEARTLASKEKETGFVPYPHDARGSNWVRMLLYWYEKDLPFPRTTADLVCTDDTYFVDKNDTEMLEKWDYSLHDTQPCEYEEVIVSRIGPLTFIAMQGEVCAGIGLRLKAALRADGPTFVTSYMGEHNLYIPTRKLVELNTYQAKVIQIQYASPVPWSLDVEDVMVDSVLQITRDFLKE
ncbi:MAG: hypothetical protein VCD00_13395 [Candidatus Hydrogenedentota bacterium]